MNKPVFNDEISKDLEESIVVFKINFPVKEYTSILNGRVDLKNSLLSLAGFGKNEKLFSWRSFEPRGAECDPKSVMSLVVLVTHSPAKSNTVVGLITVCFLL